jgi:demethylmenaquinone methyltransferase/2-methoxy-6-polyprenyl-1,4-benzoquinol methylase
VSFARDRQTLDYYERRAAEYDQWWLGEGRFADRERPGWPDEVDQLVALIAELAPTRTLDVACGTGFLTRHLTGLVVGLDQSPASVAIAQARLPDGIAICGDALALPFATGAFDHVLTSHFYGHLPEGERATFLAESRRVAPELLVIDAAQRPDTPPERWEQRTLNDGTTHRVFKRFLTPERLAAELEGATEIIFRGRWFLAVRVRWT